MDDAVAVRVNHDVQELFQLKAYRDLDHFGTRLSRAIADRVEAGDSVPDAVRAGVGDVDTAFFRVNRGVSRQALMAQLEERIGADKLRSSGLLGALGAFRAFAERQLALELWENRNDESVLRSHMQTYLEGVGFRTLKEVVTGRGRADVGLLDSRSRGLIEAKLWKGPQYFREGVRELGEYLRTERLQEGHYVVLDTTQGNALVEDRGVQWSDKVDGQTIHVFFVRVSSVVPSKVGRAADRSP